ncbi:MAG: hypothetical protein Q9207_005949 [Kuettlingeria erythrocarpa]
MAEDSEVQNHGHNSGANPSRSPTAGGEHPIEHEPAPAFSERYGEVDLTQDGFGTKARVANDGRVNIEINQQSRKLSNLLVPALRSQLDLQHDVERATLETEQARPIIGGVPDQAPSPALNIVIHVVGSRGDVQPFVALGKVLKRRYGHRIRLATHPTFRSFVEENGLEFFNIGGDPAELMAFMVKNPGLMPGMDSLRSGDVGKRRKGMYEIVLGCWRSCIEIGDGTGTIASGDSLESLHSLERSSGDAPSARPFVADAIIANPPSFAHIHCAEKLGIPLHLMFTSPALIPKPTDWGSHISVSGFYFLSLSGQFNPQPDLVTFLEAGPPPVYIGFGSIVVDDPDAMTRLIFDAVRRSGQRALVSKGWGGLGSHSLDDPDDIFMLGNVPHDWLFKRVSCVVHHGGAGTTAAGIAAGKPTVVVPFFGDQPFWGSMVAKAGAGPWPIPYKQLTSEKLAAAISEALQPEALQRAQNLGISISHECGTDRGAEDFQQKLHVDSLRCSLAPSRAAVWRVKRTNIRLSSFAATVLGAEGLLDFGNLKLYDFPQHRSWKTVDMDVRYRAREYDTEDGPWDPITGATSAIMGTVGSMMMGVADLPIEILRILHIKPSPHSPAESSLPPSPRTSTSEISNVPRKKPLPVASSAEGQTSVVSSSRESLNSGSTTTDFQKSTSISSQSLDESTSAHSNEPSANSKQPLAASGQAPSHRKSLAHAFGGSRSRSSSPDRSSLGPSGQRLSLDSQSGQISLDAAVGAGRGIGRIVGAGVKSPMDFTLNLARGFHNAPKLYGDESVRHPDKVTGIRSGLKAAGKEFGYGIYDGISGLVTQPINGAKQEGVAGFLKGFGKGIGGVILKPQAAVFALPAYTMNGIYKELQKQFGSNVQSYIVAARTAQGYEELAASTQQQRLDVVKRWQATQLELHKEKDRVKLDDSNSSNCVFLRMKNGTNANHEEKMKDAQKRTSEKAPMQAEREYSSHRESTERTPASPQPFVSADSLAHADTATFEEAIQSSVRATSRGDAEQDALIERAIRASVLELRAASKAGDQDKAVRQAIQASVAEATRAREAHPKSNQPASSTSDDGLLLALQRSLSYQPSAEVHASNELDESGVDIGDDIVKPRFTDSHAVELRIQSEDDEMHLKEAIEQSRRDHEQHVKTLEKERTDEETVVEYIKKQSLLEEKHRRSLALKANVAPKQDSRGL